MFNFYNVFEDDRYITVVKAVSEEDACKQVYMKRGSASKYSGKGLNNYRAEKVWI